MAKITVTFNGVVHYKDLTSTAPITDKIVLSTDKQEANVFFAVGEKVKTTCKYRLSRPQYHPVSRRQQRLSGDRPKAAGRAVQAHKSRSE